MSQRQLFILVLLFNTQIFAASIITNTFEKAKLEGDVRLSPSNIDVSFSSNALEKSVLTFNYTSKIHPTNPEVYNKERSAEPIEEGITTFGLDYRGIENLTLKSHYYYDPALYGILITQSEFRQRLDDDHLFTAGTQYFRSVKEGEEHFIDEDGSYGGIDFLALRTALEGEDWGVDLNYSYNYGLSAVKSSYQGVGSIYTTSMIAGGYGSYQPETWMIKGHYSLSTPLLGEDELAMWLSTTRANDSRGEEYDAYYMHWKHTIKRKTSLFVRYETKDYKDKKESVDVLKIFAGYAF